MTLNNKLFISLNAWLVIVLFNSVDLHAQTSTLLLSDAIKTGLQNYQTIRAKQHYIQSSQALVKNTKNEYLPNIIAAIQQNYGTVNGQYGPLSALGALGASSSGPAYSSQSWNSAFGAAYIFGTNWEVFSFGRLNAKIVLSEAQVKKDSADLAQEEFIQSAKISGTYLELLIARKLIENANSNLSRTQFIQQVVLARTKSGLNAGVDSSIANAEVSSAKLSLISAQNNELLIRNRLLQLLNIDPQSTLVLDSIYFKNIPANFSTSFEVSNNPQVMFYNTRIEQSNKTKSYLKKSILPGVNIFGVFQSRSSGFEYNYTPEFPDRYSKNYFDGVKPARSNYVTGVSMSWNILSIKKIKEQA
jgi:outer membrane protein TolC